MNTPLLLSVRFAAALVLAALLFSALTGCAPSQEELADGDDPLAALTAEVPSTRYDGPYWMAQYQTGRDLFDEAVRYCMEEAQRGRPNCAPVLAASDLYESMSRPPLKGRGYSGILSEDAPDSSADSLGAPVDTLSRQR